MNQYDADLALFINGGWKIGEGRDLFPVVNPASGDTIAEVPLATPADLDAALAAAETGFALWKSTPVEQRAAVLVRRHELVEKAAEVAVFLLLVAGELLDFRGVLAVVRGVVVTDGEVGLAAVPRGTSRRSPSV